MKIKCIAIPDIGSTEFSPWLTLGSTYRVLSVERSAAGRTWFRILTNMSDNGPESLGLHAAEHFEVVTQYRPTTWCDREIDGEMETSPASWQAEGFWEALYDGDSNAALVFDRERDLISREEP